MTTFGRRAAGVGDWRSLLWRAVVLAAALGLVMGVGTCLAGCSVLHWGGESAGRSPGVHVYGPGPFQRPEIAVTADTVASLDELIWKDGEFRLINGRFGQQVGSALAGEVDKIDAVGRLQMTQVEYARVTWNGVSALAHELMPFLSLLAMGNLKPTADGWSLELPKGFKIGKKTVEGSEDFSRLIGEQLRSIESLAGPPPASQPTSQPSP